MEVILSVIRRSAFLSVMTGMPSNIYRTVLMAMLLSVRLNPNVGANRYLAKLSVPVVVGEVLSIVSRRGG